MTAHSAACDLLSQSCLNIEPSQVACVQTGVWIESIHWDKIPSGFIPELQIRARSSLAFKHSIMLPNGVGTVDADYRDEISVLLYNGGNEVFPVKKGMRIAQMALNLVGRIEGVPIGGERVGGFGSTNLD